MISAVILAAGRGSRMKADINKILLNIAQKSVIKRTLEIFDCINEIDEIIIVCREEDEFEIHKESYGILKNKKIVFGGETRQESVKNGLNAVSEEADIILVHDAARCFVKHDVILKCIESAKVFGSGVAAVMVKDTLKQVEGDIIVGTIDRSLVARAQTPQAFSREIIMKAHKKAAEEGFIGTDESSLVERMGEKVKLVLSDGGNIKVTTKEDLVFGEFLLGGVSDIRVGNGYDAHRLANGRRLVLGGVDIPYEKGLEGHSDADVIVHAAMDALLGAAGERDIGYHFPPSEEKYKDISSLMLLKAVKYKLKEKNYDIINLDITLMAERPKISGYIPQMIKNIAETLSISEDRVNVKATTTEGMGFVGRQEGMAAQASACIKKS